MKSLPVQFASAFLFSVVTLTAMLVATPAQAASQSSNQKIGTKKVGFNQYIRPILSDNCFYCHGPDKNHRQADLRLDDRDIAVNTKAIVPGKPDDSEMMSDILCVSEDERMPPVATHKTLTDRQKQLLKTWIAQGAKYELNWAYIAPVRPALPAVKNKAWVKNPIDNFILATLESNGLAPAEEADKRTLLRRLSLDLTGLPPTCEEVNAYLADTSANAYERQVDRLLASPHYGERMAAPWLDAVRFADTVGFHGDQNQNVFPYRDYVINAFNNNKPFDQFTIEQLAGDLLPKPTEEQLIATCFNRLTMMTREGGAQAKEYIAKYQADRVRTVSGAWLGSTMGCCECHDHKFDPFKTKDFYSLSAYWADVKQWGVYMDYTYSPNPDLKGFSNDHPFPPEIKVPSPYLKRRMVECANAIDQLATESLIKLAPESPQRVAFQNWCDSTKAFLKRNPTGWDTLALSAASSNAPSKAAPTKRKRKSVVAAKAGSHPATPAPSVAAATTLASKTLADGSILLTGKAGENDRFEFALSAGTIAAIRLEALPNEAHSGSILRGPVRRTAVMLSAAVERESEVVTTSSTGSKSMKPAKRLAFSLADADLKDDRYSNGHAILGILDGWITNGEKFKSAQQAVWTLESPVAVHDGEKLVVTLPKNMLGCLRISVSKLASLKAVDANMGVPLAHALDAFAPKSARNSAIVARAYTMSTAWDADLLAKVRALQRKYLECMDGITPVLVTQAWAPKVTRVLPRGNWQDETGEIVEPHPPAFLPQPKVAQGQRQTRLDLARWLVAPENPLTSRAVVNRYWKQFFGNGISGIVEDLGAQGEWPSHPELLDWLAVEFRTSGWDTRHIIRLMVTSAAYRQGSNLRTNLPAMHDLDPNNRLLSTQNPRRLEAEFVRDNALAIAGLLNPSLGGPSCKPYQPDGYYANIQFPSRKYVADDDDGQYRRGIYMHWQRTFLHPMLANFDAPSREDGVCTRNVSNTPQQALTLLNDPEFVEAAKALAVLAVGHDKLDGARLEFIYQRALARSIKANEADSLKEFLANQREYFKAHSDDAVKLLKAGMMKVPTADDAIETAAWTSVCRVVLNLHETITRY